MGSFQGHAQDRGFSRPQPPLHEFGGNAAGSDSNAPATLQGLPGRVGAGSGLDLHGHLEVSA